jgi:deoxyribodipyrimidine photo-lyase
MATAGSKRSRSPSTHEAASSVARPIDPTRVRPINDIKATVGAGPVILIVDRDQRLEDNWAVLHAQNVALAGGVPLVIAFPAACPSGATLRAWGFALAGLAEMEADCRSKGIPFVVLHGPRDEVVAMFAEQENARLVVTDFSPLREDRAWREATALRLQRASPPIPVCEVDAHNVVPAWVASDRLEYAARTIRPRIMTKLGRYLVNFWPVASQDAVWKPRASPTGLPEPAGAAAAAAAPARAEPPGSSGGRLHWSWQAIDWPAILAALPLDRSVPEVAWATPGAAAGMAALRAFLDGPKPRLASYHLERNDPTLRNKTSNLSPWLHFGQLSAARAALEAYAVRSSAAAAESGGGTGAAATAASAAASPSGALGARSPAAAVRAGADAFVEELVVRRELADNFCFYNPRWATQSRRTPPPSPPLLFHGPSAP